MLLFLIVIKLFQCFFQLVLYFRFYKSRYMFRLMITTCWTFLSKELYQVQLLGVSSPMIYFWKLRSFDPDEAGLTSLRNPKGKNIFSFWGFSIFWLLAFLCFITNQNLFINEQINCIKLILLDNEFSDSQLYDLLYSWMILTFSLFIFIWKNLSSGSHPIK